MNICSMRTQTLSGELYAFTVQEVPVIVGEDTLVLLNRNFSPILKLSTLRLGSDVGVYVGDVLQGEGGSEWAVMFDFGFTAVNLQSRKRRMLYEFDELIVTRQLSLEEERLAGVEPTKFKFKFQGLVFMLADIVGVYQNRLLVQRVRERVNLDEIQQHAGFTLDGKRMYYGDLYKGHPTFMCYGRCCIQTESGVYSIHEDKYIIKSGGSEQ